MLIVHRYLLKTFFRNFALTILGSLVLFILLDLLDHVGSLVDNEATAGMIARYYLYKAIWILDQVLPISMLMATLFTIGTMARYLELTALFSSGWSLLSLTRPLIVAAALASLFSLGWREYILPDANVHRERVWETEIHHNPDRIRPTQDISVTGPDGRLFYVKRFDPNTNVITGLKILTPEGSRILERIDAERAEWDGRHWTLVKGKRRIFHELGEEIKTFESLKAKDLKVDPKSFYHDRIKLEDMNIRQLRELVEVTRLSGGDPTRALVNIQVNLAFPMVNLIVVLMGIVLASGPRKTTIASGFGLTLLISFGFYLFMSFGQSLGHEGTLPPMIAAWTGNVVFFILFLILFLRARR